MAKILHRTVRARYMGFGLKDVPQPHAASLIGFSETTKALRIMSSSKSTVAPRNSSSDISSTTSLAPERSMTASSSASSDASSRWNLYWKPEQPPGSTESRSCLSASPSARRVIRAGAPLGQLDRGGWAPRRSRAIAPRLGGGPAAARRGVVSSGRHVLEASSAGCGRRPKSALGASRSARRPQFHRRRRPRLTGWFHAAR